MNLLHKLGFFADEYLREEISKLRGARRIDAETIAQLEAENERAAAIIARQVETIRKADERFKKAVGDLAEQADEIVANKGASASQTGPSQAEPKVSALRASVPSAEVQSGSIYIGEAKQAMRNGSRSFILKWEAVERPMRVCEGGGWYSGHPTKKAWVFRSWMEHKSAPGWNWPEVADSYKENDLAVLVERAFDDALVKHGFTTAQAIEARRAETQSGSVHESAVGETDAPESSQVQP